MNYLRTSASYMWSTTEVLGKGATGSVYRGVHKRTGESVAVKAFNHASHLRPLEVQMREFEVMKRLTHENIVKLLAIEEEHESQKKVIVMELCDAGSLYTILEDPANSYGLEEEEFYQVLKDLSAGVKYLRDNNFVHRDLKPGNIMKFISVDGRSIYKVTDFGAARELEDGQQFMSLYGTEEYLHPDVYERAVLRHPANKPFGATVDLWSIGVTLFHVATGSLPFRPFGGRKNRETMHHITTSKAPGVISGVQHSDKGPIEWSRELPNTCLLNKGLRDLVTVLLAGILEKNAKKMWTFDQYFECATDIIARKVFHVFYMNEGKETCLYIQPNKTLQDLQDQIAAQIKVPCANQLLLFQRSEFTNQITPSAQVSAFPTTSYSEPIILVHTENTNIKDVTRFGKQSACFPNFPTCTSLDHDAALAKTCCSVAHVVKRIVVKLVRCQELLLKAPRTLLSFSSDNVTQLSDNCDILKQKTEDFYQRCDQLEKSISIVCDFLSMWPDHNCDKDVQLLSDWVSQMKKLREEVKKKFLPLQSGIDILKHKVLVSQRLEAEWDQTVDDCTILQGCGETADTYVRIIRASWESFMRDKNARGLSVHDEQFHILEKVRVQCTSKKLESLLQEQCLKSCLQASNKLDEWYSGMQAAMVQNRCLGEDLSSVKVLLHNYTSALLEAESQTCELSKSIILRLQSSDVPKSELKQRLQTPSVSAEKPQSYKNGDSSSYLKNLSYDSILDQLQVLKKEHCSLWEIAEENNAIIEKFSEIMKQVPDYNAKCHNERQISKD